MRLRCAILTLALGCGLSAAPAFVQGKCSTGNNAAPQSVTLTSSVGSGHELIVIGAAFSSTTTLSVSDTVNGSFTAGATHSFSQGFTEGVFYYENSGSGSDTVTIAATSNPTVAFCALEYSGLPTSGSWDQAAFAYSGSSPGTSPSLTVAQTDLVLSGLMSPSDTDGTISAGAPYTVQASSTNDAAADQGTVNSGTAAGATWTLQFATDLVMVTAGFKAGSPPPATMVPRHGASICCPER